MKKHILAVSVGLLALCLLVPLGVNARAWGAGFYLLVMQMVKDSGMLVAVVQGADTDFVSFGTADRSNGRQADESPLYRLASVSKAFTAYGVLLSKNTLGQQTEGDKGMTHNILVMEDDNDINNLLAEVLSRAGYTVRQAFSGTEARLRFDQEAPSLIMLDLMLPGMTGEQLIPHIRKSSGVPIIVLSPKEADQADFP